MKYYQEVTLKNGQQCILRSGTEEDAKAVLNNMVRTHAETDFLLSYPDEIESDEAEEAKYLKGKEESDKEVEILAIVDGRIAGSAGNDAIGKRFKSRHRAEFGISIEKKFWGQGIGRLLTEACVECAKEAGYSQLELEVVAENERAISLYKKIGFIEYGRNPKGFFSRSGKYQEVIHMRKDLNQ